jgi:hypothetical protein
MIRGRLRCANRAASIARTDIFHAIFSCSSAGPLLLRERMAPPDAALTMAAAAAAREWAWNRLKWPSLPCARMPPI